jgi:hypothetical protein
VVRARPTRRADRALDWLLPGSNPAGAVYGTLTVGALLAAESGLHDTYLETAGSVLLALVMYWFVHAYSDLLGQRLALRERLRAAELGRAFLRDWAIVRGAWGPLVVLSLCWIFGAGEQAAVTAALWTSVASLLALELLAGLRARARPAELLLEGSVGAALGLGVLALRAILH